MKLKVEKPFMDKYTSENYEVGQVIEVSDERGSELLSDERRLVSKVQKAKKSKKAEE
jgi:hypothetical protein